MTDREDRRIAPGLYLKPEPTRPHPGYQTLDVEPGLRLTVREGDPESPRDLRYDRNPDSPFHAFADLRHGFTQVVRRYHNDAALPVPRPAAYLYWKGGNGHTYFARFAGKTFRASGATRHKALRRLTERMLSEWPMFAMVALWSHNPEVTAASARPDR